ncbi:DUF1266 domain-containing protein [Streptomyces sp. NBC_01304]|uniref:DUF1266 domain-containing protein n=1 Tax=Streptomyces sp. NBC_01304 TaxID=2903818 RepID=UPI002E1228D3|nr:DUF1266 domain-containing protein [Streptomyces sp. NBC_01304]
MESVEFIDDLGDEEHDEIFPDIPTPTDGSRWLAPTDVEQHLYKLVRSENSYAYLRTLAHEGVFYPVPLQDARDTPSDQYPAMLQRESEGRVIVPVYTFGVLPRPFPGLVFEHITLDGLARMVPEDADILVVNPMTPCQEFFAVDDEERDVWRDLSEDLYEHGDSHDRVLALRTGAPPMGPLLHGLACGGHLCFTNGDPWNLLNWQGHKGYQNEVERLSEWWGVDSREEWLDIQERLLKREVSPWYWDFVLGARSALAREHGIRPSAVDAGAWRDCVETTLRERVRGEDPEFADFMAMARGLVGQILRYEARFRADELLAPDEVVRTVAAWDLGRASKMARWGRGARYAAEKESHAALERAGQGAREVYGSWEEFSAGYVLGRCLHFDDEEFGDWYTTVLTAHRALLTSPDSPWLTVPFMGSRAL